MHIKHMAQCIVDFHNQQNVQTKQTSDIPFTIPYAYLIAAHPTRYIQLPKRDSNHITCDQFVCHICFYFNVFLSQARRSKTHRHNFTLSLRWSCIPFASPIFRVARFSFVVKIARTFSPNPTDFNSYFNWNIILNLEENSGCEDS